MKNRNLFSGSFLYTSRPETCGVINDVVDLTIRSGGVQLNLLVSANSAINVIAEDSYGKLKEKLIRALKLRVGDLLPTVIPGVGGTATIVKVEPRSQDTSVFAFPEETNVITSCGGVVINCGFD